MCLGITDGKVLFENVKHLKIIMMLNLGVWPVSLGSETLYDF